MRVDGGGLGCVLLLVEGPTVFQSPAMFCGEALQGGVWVQRQIASLAVAAHDTSPLRQPLGDHELTERQFHCSRLRAPFGDTIAEYP